jgi:uncharacterized BrkB/YihY/UPF0761 family membrane protein
MAVLWVLMTLLFRLALPLLDFEESYNRLGSLMAFITWVFISSFLLILGANLASRDILPRASAETFNRWRRKDSTPA